MKKSLLVIFVILTAHIVAKEEFKPLYTGPLLAAPADNLQPGLFSIQPYLFITDSYGEYNSSWGFRRTDDLISINPLILFQTGITKWLDTTLTMQATYNKRKGHESFEYGDTQAELGIQLLKSKKNNLRPSIRLAIVENFPTGRYQKLNPQKMGTDIGGSGSYETSLKLNLSKTVYWLSYHPICLRLNFSFSFPTSIHVHGFNTYGGGFNTNGRVNPGNIFSTIFAFEFSFTRKWAYAMDLSYSHTNATKFSGKRGFLADGTIASCESGSAEIFTIAPALEYSFNPNIGIIGGTWLSIGGRNSKDFISSVISLTATF